MRAPDSDRTFQPDSRGQIRHAAAGSGGGSHSEPGLAADLRRPIEQHRPSSVVGPTLRGARAGTPPHLPRSLAGGLSPSVPPCKRLARG